MSVRAADSQSEREGNDGNQLASNAQGRASRFTVLVLSTFAPSWLEVAGTSRHVDEWDLLVGVSLDVVLHACHSRLSFLSLPR